MPSRLLPSVVLATTCLLATGCSGGGGSAPVDPTPVATSPGALAVADTTGGDVTMTVPITRTGAYAVVVTCQGTGTMRYSLAAGDSSQAWTVDCPANSEQGERELRAGGTATLTASTDPGKGIGNLQLVPR